MLIIYGKFQIGGIETFYIRLAKERARKNLPTTFLFLSEEKNSDPLLIEQLRLHSKIFFSNDIFHLPKFFGKFPLFSPLKKNVLLLLFKDATQIHIYDAYAGLFAQRISKFFDIKLPISVGFYHYMKHLWGSNNIPLYEKINREFIFTYLPSDSLLFYSRDVRKLYQKYYRKEFNFSKYFRIGVIDGASNPIKIPPLIPSRIISVGRLVPFKTYFIQILQSLYILKQEGCFFQFDIYGDGPFYDEIASRIEELNLEEQVKIYHSFPYRDFSKIVGEYDLFIGSGTSVIEASSLGIPSIVGIENNNEPTSYGYFSDVYDREYNLNFLNIPKYEMSDLIRNILNIKQDDYLELCDKHIIASKEFTIEKCSQEIENLSDSVKLNEYFSFNLVRYEFSRLYNIVLEKAGYRKSEDIFTSISEIKKNVD